MNRPKVRISMVEHKDGTVQARVYRYRQICSTGQCRVVVEVLDAEGEWRRHRGGAVPATAEGEPYRLSMKDGQVRHLALDSWHG